MKQKFFFIYPPTDCKSLVLFNGILNSTIGIGKITKFIRDITYLNTRSLDIFIGLILGDAYFKRSSEKHNIRIGFKQSIINFPFMWDVFMQLSHYCSSVPRFELAKIKNKTYGQIILETRAYPVLHNLYDLFVINGRKSIHPDLFFYLSPRSLAYWIMCDGVSAQYGLTICTDCFTLKEVIILMNILKIKYNLNSSIHTSNGKPRIYIKAESMKELRILVEPYILLFSKYKLYKGKRFTLKV